MQAIFNNQPAYSTDVSQPSLAEDEALIRLSVAREKKRKGSSLTFDIFIISVPC